MRRWHRSEVAKTTPPSGHVGRQPIMLGSDSSGNMGRVAKRSRASKNSTRHSNIEKATRSNFVIEVIFFVFETSPMSPSCTVAHCDRLAFEHTGTPRCTLCRIRAIPTTRNWSINLQIRDKVLFRGCGATVPRFVRREHCCSQICWKRPFDNPLLHHVSTCAKTSQSSVACNCTCCVGSPECLYECTHLCPTRPRHVCE